MFEGRINVKSDGTGANTEITTEKGDRISAQNLIIRVKPGGFSTAEVELKAPGYDGGFEDILVEGMFFIKKDGRGGRLYISGKGGSVGTSFPPTKDELYEAMKFLWQ